MDCRRSYSSYDSVCTYCKIISWSGFCKDEAKLQFSVCVIVIFNLPLDRYIKFDIINMEFEIIFYKNSSGSSPVEEALDRLKVTNIILWRQALKGIEKIKNREYHKEPLSKYLESGLWELRVKSGTGILRIIYTFKKGQIIILLHLFVKKKQKTPADELNIARKRLLEIRMEVN